MTHESEPPRLLQTRDAELSELLPGLQRARAQGPSSEQLARICAGFAVRATGSTTENGTQGEPERTDTTSGGAARASGSGTGTGAAKLLKLVVVGMLIGGAAFYGSRAQRRVPADRAERAARPVAAAAQAQATPRAALPAQAPPVDAPLETPHVERAPARNAAGARAPAARRAPPAAEASATDVDAELALLKRARAEVRPNPARALALTREHAARYAHGALAEEREVIAIEALLVRGQRAAAQARVQAFFTDHPASAHGRRVRALLAEHDATFSDENPSPPPHPSH